jgi:hypothetical protein
MSTPADDLGLVIGAGGPQFAADADLPAVVGDFLDDLRGAPDEGRGPGAQQRWLLDVPDRDRADHAEPGRGGHGERDQLEGQPGTGHPDHTRHHRADRNQPEGQRGRHDLGNAEYCGEDQPDNQRSHGYSRERERRRARRAHAPAARSSNSTVTP